MTQWYTVCLHSSNNLCFHWEFWSQHLVHLILMMILVFLITFMSQCKPYMFCFGHLTFNHLYCKIFHMWRVIRSWNYSNQLISTCGLSSHLQWVVTWLYINSSTTKKAGHSELNARLLSTSSVQQKLVRWEWQLILLKGKQDYNHPDFVIWASYLC